MGINDTITERLKTMRGAMDNILPIKVETSVRNPETGQIEMVTKTDIKNCMVRDEMDQSVKRLSLERAR